MKTVVVTREQADTSAAKGEGPIEHLIRRFWEEHGLKLEINDFYTKKFNFKKVNDSFEVAYNE